MDRASADDDVALVDPPSTSGAHWANRDNDALYFASEIKSLLRVPGFERRLNLEALHHYLSFKHIPCPLSIFEGVKMLPPAHSLCRGTRPFRAATSRTGATRHWWWRWRLVVRQGERRAGRRTCKLSVMQVKSERFVWVIVIEMPRTRVFPKRRDAWPDRLRIGGTLWQAITYRNSRKRHKRPSF